MWSIFPRVQADRPALACLIHGEVAGDLEEPGVEARATVEGGAALEHPQPGFLDQVLNAVPSAEEIDEVSREAMLEAGHQRVQEREIASLQAKGDLFRTDAHALSRRTLQRTYVGYTGVDHEITQAAGILSDARVEIVGETALGREMEETVCLRCTLPDRLHAYGSATECGATDAGRVACGRMVLKVRRHGCGGRLDTTGAGCDGPAAAGGAGAAV